MTCIFLLKEYFEKHWTYANQIQQIKTIIKYSLLIIYLKYSFINMQKVSDIVFYSFLFAIAPFVVIHYILSYRVTQKRGSKFLLVFAITSFLIFFNLDCFLIFWVFLFPKKLKRFLLRNIPFIFHMDFVFIISNTLYLWRL